MTAWMWLTILRASDGAWFTMVSKNEILEGTWKVAIEAIPSWLNPSRGPRFAQNKIYSWLVLCIIFLMPGDDYSFQKDPIFPNCVTHLVCLCDIHGYNIIILWPFHIIYTITLFINLMVLPWVQRIPLQLYYFIKGQWICVAYHETDQWCIA